MSEPLLAWDARRERRRLFVIVGAVLVLIAGLGAGVIQLANRGGPAGCCLGLSGLFAVFGPVAFLLNRWEITRYARVELHSDRVVVKRRTTMHAHLEIAFATLAGFRDRSADHVELLPRPGQEPIPAMYLSIPTPTEESRTKLLAVLLERGVPRVE